MKRIILDSGNFIYDENVISTFLSLSGNSIIITEDAPFQGLEYFEDYSANYTDRSLVDKAYVDSIISSGGTGPQGPQGPQGISGETGPQGPQGISGITPSVSAVTNDVITQLSLEDGWRTVYKDKANLGYVTTSGGTAIITMGWIKIDGGTMGANGYIDMTAIYERGVNASGAGTGSFRLYFTTILPTLGATGVPTGGSAIALHSPGTANRYAKITRTMFNNGVTSGSTSILFATQTATNDAIVVNSWTSTFDNFNTDNDFYLVFTFQPGSTADTFRHKLFTAEVTYMS